MDLDSFADLAANFKAVRRRLPAATRSELMDTGKTLEAAARQKFGTYQAGWSPLAASTQAERSRLGYTPDDPLFRTGKLRDAVKHTVEGQQVFIGIQAGETTLTDSKGRAVDAALVMAVQEYGSARVPPRPVFGTVILQDLDRVHDAFMIGLRARSGL